MPTPTAVIVSGRGCQLVAKGFDSADGFVFPLDSHSSAVTGLQLGSTARGRQWSRRPLPMIQIYLLAWACLCAALAVYTKAVIVPALNAWA